jgi:hypothetical protein
MIPQSFDIYFQRLGTETAVILPSSPTTVTGLRDDAALEKWWSVAKRHAFRSWPYLINSPTGIFLVTKTVQTKRYAHCLSKGTPGQVSQIRIHGDVTVPAGSKKIVLPAATTQWVPVRNDLEFELEDSGGKSDYTIFIEREASRMFALTDTRLRDAAARAWKYTSLVTQAHDSSSSIPPSASFALPPAGIPLSVPGSPSAAASLLSPMQDPFAPELSKFWSSSASMISQNSMFPNTYSSNSLGPLTSTSSLPNWSTLLSAGAPRVASQRAETAGWGKRTSVTSPKFDATGRLCLADGWFLIRGDDSYFLEFADSGLDVPTEAICNTHLTILLMAAVQSLLNLLTKHAPEPVRWIASSDQTSPMAQNSIALPMNIQNSLPVSLMNTGAMYAAYSGLQSPMTGASAISTPFGMPFLSPTTHGMPGIAGMTMANPFAVYPSLASNDRRDSSGSIFESPSAPIVIPPDKQFDCALAWM